MNTPTNPFDEILNQSSTNSAYSNIRADKKLNSLTSLRFIAAMAVVIYHVPFVLPGASTTNIFEIGGAIGVSFFFVLSGFILTYAHPIERPLDYKQFFAKRMARIYPLHLLTFAIWSILFFQSWGNPLVDKINSGIANVLLIQAFFVGNLFNLGFNAVSWSISVELFFYLLFPILRKPFIAGAVIAGYIALVMLFRDNLDAFIRIAPNFFYFNPLARLAEFSLGIFACRSLSRLTVVWSFGTFSEIFAIALASLVVMTYSRFPHGVQYLCLGVSFSILIAVMSREVGYISRFFTIPPLVFLGEASFSLYLIHHMWFRILQHLVGERVTGLTLLMLGVTSAVLLSMVLYIFFERPARVLVTRWLLDVPALGIPSVSKQSMGA